MPHESGVMPLRLRLGAESIAVKVPARLSARRIWGCLILFFSAVAGRSQVAASAARDTRAGHG